MIRHLMERITHIDRSEPAGWDRELIREPKCDKRKSHHMPTVIVRIFTEADVSVIGYEDI